MRAPGRTTLYATPLPLTEPRRWCMAPDLASWGRQAPDPRSAPMKYPKRSQSKYAKSRYRVRNWAEYEAGLQKRGDLTVWPLAS